MFIINLAIAAYGVVLFRYNYRKYVSIKALRIENLHEDEAMLHLQAELNGGFPMMFYDLSITKEFKFSVSVSVDSGDSDPQLQMERLVSVRLPPISLGRQWYKQAIDMRDIRFTLENRIGSLAKQLMLKELNNSGPTTISLALKIDHLSFTTSTLWFPLSINITDRSILLPPIDINEFISKIRADSSMDSPKLDALSLFSVDSVKFLEPPSQLEIPIQLTFNLLIQSLIPSIFSLVVPKLSLSIGTDSKNPYATINTSGMILDRKAESIKCDIQVTLIDDKNEALKHMLGYLRGQKTTLQIENISISGNESAPHTGLQRIINTHSPIQISMEAIQKKLAAYNNKHKTAGTEPAMSTFKAFFTKLASVQLACLTVSSFEGNNMKIISTLDVDIEQLSKHAPCSLNFIIGPLPYFQSIVVINDVNVIQVDVVHIETVNIDKVGKRRCLRFGIYARLLNINFLASSIRYHGKNLQIGLTHPRDSNFFTKFLNELISDVCLRRNATTMQNAIPPRIDMHRPDVVHGITCEMQNESSLFNLKSTLTLNENLSGQFPNILIKWPRLCIQLLPDYSDSITQSLCVVNVKEGLPKAGLAQREHTNTAPWWVGRAFAIFTGAQL